ncbi:amino acid adenylation domain-containing protein [Saccharothrix coeruleofusca]|uniref:Carrier domain-containing protein n=1 Tax=Saccharothrix coeruleofusca TaxID=33919 RepID=A0A918AM94_9PSEU|nr:amino acid adenylation domain-containing protein [Saccharothrix coeruleofusca]MBP2336050.1 amino acid adenylation domain-containing protein [Saccharothrix coeruleofusca]GGP55808.1 hypothetical protein GCM10010185_30470 [Saccharothrix coeruleofusca]
MVTGSPADPADPSTVPAPRLAGEWFWLPAPRPASRLRLFCLPHAGGDVAAFGEFGRALPDDIELWAVRLPGRGGRTGTPMPATLDELVQRIRTAMHPHIEHPYAILGQSLGALVAFNVAACLDRPPVACVLAALLPPRCWQEPPGPAAGQDLLPFLEATGGFDAAALAEAGLLERSLAVTAGDLDLCAGYRHPEQTLLDCPVLVLSGEDDPTASPPEMAEWRHHVGGSFTQATLPGGHLVIGEAPAAAAELVSRFLTSAQGFDMTAVPTDRPAVLSAEGVLTRAELDDRTARYATALSEAGLRPGDVVAISLPDGADAVCALLAARQAGVAFVWLDENQPGERRAATVADCAPSGLIARPNGMTSVSEGAALLSVDGAAVEVLRPKAPGLARPSVPTDTEYLVYTSGSTGTPKGIVQRAGNLAQFAEWLAAELALDERARVLQWGSLVYDGAYVEIAMAVHAGATLVVPPAEVKADPAKVHAWMAEHRVTHLLAVPSLCRPLVQCGPLQHVRAVSLHGEALRADLVHEVRRNFPGAVVRNLYGPSECISATVHVVADPAEDPIPLGTPIPGREIDLTDESGLPVPTGEVGEVRIRSPHLAHGYLNRPAETASAFLAGDVYRTGDLARRTADGRLLFSGRADDQVKIRGVRVELGELEAALGKAADVARTAARTYGDDPENPRLAAYLQPRRGRRVDIAAVHRQLINTLPTYLVPGAYVVLDEFPLAASGKIDRRRLPIPNAAESPSEPYFATETERRLEAIWREVIGCARARPDDDFFTAGGHSLLAPRIVAEVAVEFGVELPVRAVFDHPTVREFATRIDLGTEAVAERAERSSGAAGPA